jgi:chorismate mutase
MELRSVVMTAVLGCFIVNPTLLRADDLDAALAPYRAKIDVLDGRIIALLNERASVVRQVGEVKRRANAPAAAPARADQVLDAAASRSEGPLDPAAVRRIYAKILEEMTAFEESHMKRSTPR